MKPILSALFSWLSFRFRSRASLELEVIALRHQLDVLHRRHWRKYRTKTWLQDADRILWAWLYKIWPRAASHMVLLSPKSVIRWHHEGYCFYWRVRRKFHVAGRRIDPEIRKLIREMSIANPLWGPKRIHGELKKLGIAVSHWSIQKYRVRAPFPPSPTWKVFIKNQMKYTAATDMFVVITAKFKILYSMIVLGHDRRKIIHHATTQHPTDDWLANQIRAAFQHEPMPRYLVRDRDALYRESFRKQLRDLGIQEVLIAPQCPWQNMYVERVIWSIRRECLDHVIVMNERHLHDLLSSYVEYYNKYRTHRSLNYDSPETRQVEPPGTGKIIAIPQVGGLHHRYTRRRVA